MSSILFLPASTGKHFRDDGVNAAARGYLSTPMVKHLLSCDQCCHAIEAQKLVISARGNSRNVHHMQYAEDRH
jgi:hypothetical protein